MIGLLKRRACVVYLNPRLTEERAGRQDEDEVEDGVERVLQDVCDGQRRRYVVRQARDRNGVAWVVLLVLPHAQQAHQQHPAVAVVQQLREEVEVADEGGLEDDGHVAGVEELDGVFALLAAVLGVLDRQVHPPPWAGQGMEGG